METEAEMSPRGQDSGVAAAAGSPERDVGWPLRDGLRDGPPCPGSGLPSEARRGRVHRSEPPRLWRSVTQPTTPGLGVRVVPAQGAGRSGEPRGGGSQQSRLQRCEEGRPWEPAGGDRQGPCRWPRAQASPSR